MRRLRIVLLVLVLGLVLAGTALAAQFRYAHIASNTTTVVRNNRGLLYSVVINTKGATGNTATLYDNTAGSGTVIAIIDTTTALGTIFYNVTLTTGLTVVTATGSAADLTIVTD